MKKGFRSLAVLGFVMALASCGGTSSDNTNKTSGSSSVSKLKVGLIALHDNNSTYDKNFIEAFKKACDNTGVEGIIKTNVPESEEAYNKANDLVDEGCKFIFADSFGHEAHILKAAKENSGVQFSHATGTQAHTAKVANYHNAFASIYEGRYLAGVAAGMKLKKMLEANPSTSKKLGYVGAWPYAEVISGFTSWYLGVKSIVNDVTMDVQFTDSWYDETAERSTAEALIKSGCSLISQHADSYGAPKMCEEKGVPNVTYNGSTETECPNTYLISSRVNWEPYFEYAIGQVKAGKAIDTDWTGNLGSDLYSGSVALSTPGKKAAVDGTEAKLNEVAAKLRDGSLKVFDTSKFTVKGKAVTSYKADVDDFGDYVGETEAIKTEKGITYFAESEFRSAPYFNLQIDGITWLNHTDMVA